MFLRDGTPAEALCLRVGPDQVADYGTVLDAFRSKRS